MKANRKFKIENNAATNMAVVGGIVAFLLAVIIGVMVYFEMIDSMPTLEADRIETFTGYSHGDNASAQSVYLDATPGSPHATYVNVTCWSSSAGTLSYPSFVVIEPTELYMAAGAASNFTQINVTYTSRPALEQGTTTDMASSVFGLLPIIAIVVIAGVILGIVLVMGGKKGGGL